jgi:uncharacterized membrane protein YhiD involved in acid resistance
MPEDFIYRTIAKRAQEETAEDTGRFESAVFWVAIAIGVGFSLGLLKPTAIAIAILHTHWPLFLFLEGGSLLPPR